MSELTESSISKRFLNRSLPTAVNPPVSFNRPLHSREPLGGRVTFMNYQHLFRPLVIGSVRQRHPESAPENNAGLNCRNRIVMAPLTRCRSGEQRIPTKQMANYYRQRSGAGLIIAEATLIDPDGAGMLNTPGVYNDIQIEKWKQITTEVHSGGGKIALQLWHCGRSSHSDLLDGKRPVAPSSVALQGKEVHTKNGKKPCSIPAALEPKEISAIIKKYAQAAKNAMDAGFDAIELHAANGYLIDQFLQSKSNHRTDLYGGNIENRFRFLDEILEETLKVIPADKIGIRLSPNGNFNDMGSPDFRETFCHVCQKFEQLGGAFLHLMDGLDFGFHQLGLPITLKETRQWYNGVLIGNCGYTAELAEKRIRDGDADMIAFGRPFITNPDFPQRLKNGWPLADLTPRESWYTHQGPGYDDHPAYSNPD